MRLLLVCLALTLTMACANHSQSLRVSHSLDELHQLMQGSYNSEQQAKADSSYFNISLHMYPIWEDKGKFLYVEQALNAKQDKPYRQRIYALEQVDDTSFNSYIYKIPNDSLYIGAWRKPARFNHLSIDSLQLLEGCKVVLYQISDTHYKGSTADSTCPSQLYGAHYAHSSVELFSDKLISWDRGFSKEKQQVWGASEGGYEFIKLDFLKE